MRSGLIRPVADGSALPQVSRKRYTKFQQGIMAAAYHLDYVGEDKLRDEVLRMCGLTIEDFRREYPDG